MLLYWLRLHCRKKNMTVDYYDNSSLSSLLWLSLSWRLHFTYKQRYCSHLATLHLTDFSRSSNAHFLGRLAGRRSHGFNGLDHLEPFQHLAKHHVLAVQPGSGDCGDEELRSLSIWSSTIVLTTARKFSTVRGTAKEGGNRKEKKKMLCEDSKGIVDGMEEIVRTRGNEDAKIQTGEIVHRHGSSWCFVYSFADSNKHCSCHWYWFLYYLLEVEVEEGVQEDFTQDVCFVLFRNPDLKLLCEVEVVLEGEIEGEGEIEEDMEVEVGVEEGVSVSMLLIVLVWSRRRRIGVDTCFEDESEIVKWYEVASASASSYLMSSFPMGTFCSPSNCRM